MTDFLPYIFNIPSLLLGFYLFITAFKIYRPKHKTEIESLKYDKWLVKFGAMAKVFSVVLMLKGVYGLIYAKPEVYKLSPTKESNGWEKNARAIMVEKCIEDSGLAAVNYPKINRKYCECSVDKIMSSYTEEQYLSISQKPQQEQIMELTPKFQTCLDELKRKTDSTNRILRKIKIEKEKRNNNQD